MRKLSLFAVELECETRSPAPRTSESAACEDLFSPVEGQHARKCAYANVSQNFEFDSGSCVLPFFAVRLSAYPSETHGFVSVVLIAFSLVSLLDICSIQRFKIDEKLEAVRHLHGVPNPL